MATTDQQLTPEQLSTLNNFRKLFGQNLTWDQLTVAQQGGGGVLGGIHNVAANTGTGISKGIETGTGSINYGLTGNESGLSPTQQGLLALAAGGGAIASGAGSGGAAGGDALAGEAAADIAAGDAVTAAGGYAGGGAALAPSAGTSLAALQAPAATPSAGGFFQNGNWIPTAVGGGLTILGMEQQKKAADEAARLAGQATTAATAENRRQFDIGQENLAPWLSAGKGALTEQQKLMGINGFDPANSLAELQKSPGYQFRLKTGRQGLDASSAARGGMGSGKAMTAAGGWNQDYASNEYGNRLNQLAGLSNTGQTTGNQMATQGANYATNNANMLLGNANMQGAAGIAGANARSSGLYGLASLGLNAYDKYRG